MNQQENVISFELAKLAKEAGFDWVSGKHYQDGYNLLLHDFSTCTNNRFPRCYEAPTLSVLDAWLRNKHEIHIMIREASENRGYYPIIHGDPIGWYDPLLPSKEEAFIEGIKIALNRLKKHDKILVTV